MPVFRRRVLAVAAATLFIGLGAETAEACICSATYSGQPACQARFAYTQIFRARVTNIVKAFADPKDVVEDNSRRISFDVLESFVGVVGRTYELHDNGSSCSFPFRAGNEYLVYVLNGVVTLCSPTKEIEDAAEDLKYLRAVSAASPREGRIIGLVMHEEYAQPELGRRPFAGARITVEGQGLRRLATTGSDGRFEVRMPPGKYRVLAQVDERMYTSPMTMGETELRDSRGCATADFQVRFNGHVIARLVTRDGTPVPYVGVTLTPSGTGADTSAQADGAGILRLDHVAPGRYLLRFEVPNPNSESGRTRIYFPGTSDGTQARTITVGVSALVDVGDFAVPDGLRFVTVTGVVRDSFGNLIEGSNVSVTQAGRPNSTEWTVRTQADGRFSLALLDGHEYRLTAYMTGGARADVALRAAADAAPVVLVPIKR